MDSLTPGTGDLPTKERKTRSDKWVKYNFTEVRDVKEVRSKSGKLRISSKVAAARCGVCSAELAGHTDSNLSAHRANCPPRIPLADLSTNATGPVVHTASPRRPPAQIVPSVNLHPGAHPLQCNDTTSPSSNKITQKRQRRKNQYTPMQQHVNLLKFAVRFNIEFADLDCRASREFIKSLHPTYSIPPVVELQSDVIDEALSELSELQDTLRYKNFIIVLGIDPQNSEKAYHHSPNLKWLFSYAVSCDSDYVYIDSRNVDSEIDLKVVVRKFCDDSVNKANCKFKISTKYLMHEGLGSLIDGDEARRTINYHTFHSLRDIFCKLSKLTESQVETLEDETVQNYNLSLQKLMASTKDPSYTLANAFQDFYDLYDAGMDDLLYKFLWDNAPPGDNAFFSAYGNYKEKRDVFRTLALWCSESNRVLDQS
ncbi:hypothetical protein QAD02_017595 [Eretmocerus hayati]|uniref:Uncharacterized protein n=1 Tax=Eretmocerus hayati TaxID=131215 RepID=A0ACC2PEA8_9HYME|nr:hypothetical protein QAD02_017595 [Eretmocerus hayati]